MSDHRSCGEAQGESGVPGGRGGAVAGGDRMQGVQGPGTGGQQASMGGGCHGGQIGQRESGGQGGVTAGAPWGSGAGSYPGTGSGAPGPAPIPPPGEGVWPRGHGAAPPPYGPYGPAAAVAAPGQGAWGYGPAAGYVPPPQWYGGMPGGPGGPGSHLGAPRGAIPGAASGGMAEMMEALGGGGALASLGRILGSDDKEFWKGALVGAAAVLLLTNETVQRTLFRTGAQAKEAVKSGVEKVRRTAGEQRTRVQAEASGDE